MNTAEAFVVIALAGLLPALATAGYSVTAMFLAPLFGAVTAAVAAELELIVGGSVAPWFVLLALGANGVVIGLWLRGRKRPTWRDTPWWSVLTLAVLVAALSEPLRGLGASMIGYDTNAIWTTHTLMVWGGHHDLLSGLRNRAYQFSNPDYPPLIPATGAMAYSLFGHVDLIAGTRLTALLNACGVGVIASGVMAISSPLKRNVRVVTLALAGLLCVGIFSLAGDYAVNGYADLLWASTAASAVLWGLVVQKDTSALFVAWACAMVASLTKNEGLVITLPILFLIAIRYAGVPGGRMLGSRQAAHLRRSSPSWPLGLGRLAAMTLVPALPGLVWAAAMRILGIKNAFIAGSTTESHAERASATFSAVLPHLALLPVDLVVAAIGWYWFSKARRSIEIGNQLWLAASWVIGTGAILAVYVFGELEIHWWLATSVYRTMIFSQLLLLVDITVWGVVAACGLSLRQPAGARERRGKQSDPLVSEAQVLVQ